MGEDYRYIAIDLKSFYASVECRERGLDPLTTNLVVADASRTDKTICLAVSPGLKSYGVSGRPRLFEVIQAVKLLNAQRRSQAPQRRFTGKSYDTVLLNADPALELDYIIAPPRMSLYMKYSTEIYKIYLKYVAPEDVHVYSCDEVFMDVSHYLETYHMTAHELAVTMIRDVLSQTGITATAGIGTNLYLCKVAMDIVAKHLPADADGVRIAELDEKSYRKQLWSHTPLTDFWRVGHGTEQRLYRNGLLTMGDVARYSEINEDLLYKVFGVNAELLIDHAWGWEPCTIDLIKQYRPENNSLSSGQVLQRPYHYEEAAIIVREMTELLTLDLVEKELVTDQMVLTIGYDVESLMDPSIRSKYHGEIRMDHYGRLVPKHAHGTVNLERQMSSTRLISEAVMELYRKITDPNLLVRRVVIAACRVVPEKEAETLQGQKYEQLDLFTDYAALEAEREQTRRALEKERSLQRAVLHIKRKFGKNAVLKGTDLQEGAMTIERNLQIGGHKA
ncbi:MAG: DNA methylase [Lachnospiraceae bacterium]|nr:DNA methylase [Lachnospiraceae bacterium]MBR1852500.1 DNA methylase [Lachnospiraceae bacterium]